ncbi:MAG TPA: CYTH domain-containing protein [Fimbriimonadaceae bacterium]|jgi:CYTH domain-containing protein
MAQEIELKFLVDPAKLPALPEGEQYVQAYLSIDPAVRVRIVNSRVALFTAKGAGLKSRVEIEFEIPLDKGLELVKLSPFTVIEKTRHKLPINGFTWEVDFYHGPLDGLVTAEVELPSEDIEVERPNFVTEDVTERREYKNSNLAAHGLPAP